MALTIPARGSCAIALVIYIYFFLCSAPFLVVFQFRGKRIHQKQKQQQPVAAQQQRCAAVGAFHVKAETRMLKHIRDRDKRAGCGMSRKSIAMRAAGWLANARKSRFVKLSRAGVHLNGRDDAR